MIIQKHLDFLVKRGFVDGKHLALQFEPFFSLFF